MAKPNLSEQDFQRLQESLLELKNQNYTLQEENNRAKTALATAQDRIGDLERDLDKAQKSVIKSKKATEVQMLIRDNESLQKQLRSQEDEYRQQNTALLTELSNLVNLNEKMEQEIRSLQDPNPEEPYRPLSAEITALREENANVRAELEQTKKELRAVKEDHARIQRIQQAPSVEAPTEMVQVGMSGVRFHRQDTSLSLDNDDVTDQGTQSSAKLEKELFETRDLLDKVQSQCDGILSELESKQRQLRESQANHDTSKLRVEELEHEQLAQAQEMERLKTQLEAGYTSYNTFKAAKNEEIDNLTKKIATVTNEALEKDTEISQMKEVIKEADELKAKVESLERQKRDASDQVKSLNEEETRLKLEIQAKDQEISDIKSSLATLEASLKEMTERCNELESSLERTNNDLIQAKNIFEKQLEVEKESNRSMIKVLESEKTLQLRDMTMQLEIANAQRSEFENACSMLKDEVKDLHEEKKIAEKKGVALTKDLKRQLLAEKQRNEKLQEKMKEISIADVVPDTGSAKESDPDVTSNSSWSLVSSPVNRSTPIPFGQSQNRTSPDIVPESPDHSDSNKILLEKIASLQDDRQVLLEKIHMLENSAGGMADELLRKSTLIQYYCMEGGKAVVQGTTTNAPVSASDHMKKIMNVLVHPDVETRKQMQKMQNLVEETLTKNMHLQKDIENLSEEVVRLSKAAALGKT